MVTRLYQIKDSLNLVLSIPRDVRKRTMGGPIIENKPPRNPLVRPAPIRARNIFRILNLYPERNAIARIIRTIDKTLFKNISENAGRIIEPIIIPTTPKMGIIISSFEYLKSRFWQIIITEVTRLKIVISGTRNFIGRKNDISGIAINASPNPVEPFTTEAARTINNIRIN